MDTTADAVIAALVSGHEQLAPVVRSLTTEQLTGPSTAAEWDLSQVISHLGSGAVITEAGLAAALAGEPSPDGEANKAVWARWDAMTPQDRADHFVEANESLLAAYAALDDDTKAELRIDMGFLPAPVDVATAARFRLNEFALHSWDVRASSDQEAVLHPDATPLLLDQLGFMLGWLVKPAALDGRRVEVQVTLTDLDRTFGLSLGEGPSVGDAPAQPDATLTLPAEAWLRLASGRLAPEHTPAGVEATGALTLTQLRQVFPGY